MLSVQSSVPKSTASHQYSAEHYIGFLLQYFPKWISQQAVESIIKQHSSLEEQTFQEKFFSVYGQVIPDFHTDKIEKYLEQMENIPEEKIMQITTNVSKIVDTTLNKKAANDTSRRTQNQPKQENNLEQKNEEEAEELTQEQIDKCEEIKKEIQPIFDRIVKIRNFFDKKSSNWPNKPKNFEIWRFNHLYWYYNQVIVKISRELRSDVYHPNQLVKYKSKIREIEENIMIASRHAYVLYIQYILERPMAVDISKHLERTNTYFRYQNFQWPLNVSLFKQVMKDPNAIKTIDDIFALHEKFMQFMKKYAKIIQNKK